mgnify:FL=1
MLQADQNAAAMMSSAAAGPAHMMHPQSQAGPADPSAQYPPQPSHPTQYPNQSM